MLSLTSAGAALVFLVLVSPICAWVAWSDAKWMKIPNSAVLALMLVFLIAGPLVMPLEAWAWRWSHFLVMLALGFVLNQIAHFGAGDAKFGAAMAPFFASADLPLVLKLLTAFLLAAFAAHRLVRALPAARAMAPDWVSWRRADFPMGLALIGTLWSYLFLVALSA